MPSPCPILVLFAHPALHKSRVNRVLVQAIGDIPSVTVHDLYEVYPLFDIDVRREQALVEAHELIIFHFPLYWYSTPALLKEWLDLVLQHGWAYGHAGNALQGKLFWCVTTTGGDEPAYERGGVNRFTLRELLAPLEQTADLCGMRFLPPFVVHGTHRLDLTQMETHARDYRRVIELLRDRRIDLAAAKHMARINADIDALIRASKETGACTD